MQDPATYRQAPQHILGMTQKEAVKYLINNDCLPFSVAKENGKDKVTTDQVQILMNVDQGRVVGTQLESRKFGIW